MRMMQAFVHDDPAEFREIADSFIAEERRKNHHILARELERILANGMRNKSRSKGTDLSILPPQANPFRGTKNEMLPCWRE